MNVLIIEDENPAAQRLAAFVEAYDNNIVVLAMLDSVKSSVDWLKNNVAPDLIFSDIHLSDGLSFEIFQEVTIQSAVIFTTAYDQYAINAFEVNSVDYLLKPIRFENFSKSIDKYKQLKSTFEKTENISESAIETLISSIQGGNSNFKSRFLVKNGQKIKSIKTTEIAYFYSEDKLTLLITQDGSKFPVDYSLDEVITMLDPKQFFKANRKFLIHIDSAKEIHPYFKGRLKLILQPIIATEVIVSSEKTPLFKNWLSS